MKTKITKVFSVSLVSVFGAILLLGAGCSSPTAILTGQLTDEDKCIELIALSLTAASYTSTQDFAALEALQQKIDNLESQYGWSEESDETSNICQPFSTKEGFMNRVGARAQELLLEDK